MYLHLYCRIGEDLAAPAAAFAPLLRLVRLLLLPLLLLLLLPLLLLLLLLLTLLLLFLLLLLHPPDSLKGFSTGMISMGFAGKCFY